MTPPTPEIARAHMTPKTVQDHATEKPEATWMSEMDASGAPGFTHPILNSVMRKLICLKALPFQISLAANASGKGYAETAH